MRYLLSLACLWFCLSLASQPFDRLDIACSAGHLEADMARDSSGHLIVAGEFGDTLLVVPPDSVPKHIAGARLNPFVAKVDEQGEVHWVHAFTSETLSRIYEVEADADDNIYLAGQFFHGEFDADPGPGEVILSPVGGSRSFVIKLDKQGVFQWVKSFTFALKTMALDASGDIFIGGFYYEKADLDPGAGEFWVESPKQADGLVVKLGRSGDFLWGTRLGEDILDEVSHLEIDSGGQPIVGGLIQNSYSDSPGYKRFFLNKIDNENGQPIWYKTIRSSKLVELKDLMSHRNGDIVLTGEFEDSVRLDTSLLIAKGYADAFVYKLQSNGAIVWAKRFGDDWQDEGLHVFIDRDEKIHWSGEIGQRSLLDERPLYYDQSFYLILQPDGSLFRNYVWGSTATDYGYRFWEGRDGFIYKIGRVFFRQLTIKRSFY